MPSVCILKIQSSGAGGKRSKISAPNWLALLYSVFLITSLARASGRRPIAAGQVWGPDEPLEKGSKSSRLYFQPIDDDQIEPSSDLEYSNLPMPIENGDANMSPGPLNSSTTDSQEGLYEIPPSIVVLLCIMYISVSLIAVCGNLMVFYVVLASKKMRNVTNMFIANLALADVLIGSLSIPFQFIAALLQRWLLPDVFCKVCPTVSVSSKLLRCKI